MKVTKCDRCKKEIKKDTFKVDLKIGEKDYHFDEVCGDCINYLAAWADNGMIQPRKSKVKDARNTDAD